MEEGGRMAQTQRAANGKGRNDLRARVLGQNLRAGGERPRTKISLERKAELRRHCILGQEGATEGLSARE